MTTSSSYTHRPNCLAEYGSWSTTCLTCGSALVLGPSPAQEATGGGGVGRVEVVQGRKRVKGIDRFANEEAPIVLTSMVEEDVDAFLGALEEARAAILVPIEERGLAREILGIEL